MLQKLRDFLGSLAPEGIALAFSGGVDSALLLAVLAEMNHEKPLRWSAFTLASVLQDGAEIDEAKAFASKYGVELNLFAFNPFLIREIEYNHPDRCYYCKKAFFTLFADKAQKCRLKHLIDGTNADDLKVYRPGRKALREIGVVSPLAELGLGKEQIRRLSQTLGLSTANKPSVPCLATRFEYNTKLDDKTIAMAAKGEAFIKNLLPEVKDVRLRVHKNLARLEVSAQDIALTAARKDDIVRKLSTLGFDYVTLDLQGFRSGSFDAGLSKKM